jgi:hypothetical protein
VPSGPSWTPPPTNRIKKNWSFTPGEEQGLKVCENAELRRMFGPKRNEITEGWRKLLNELHISYSLPDSNRVIK